MTLTTGDTLWRTPRHEPWPHWEVSVHRAPGGNGPITVRFLCQGRTSKRLDQVAAWLPAVGAWDQHRWVPNLQRRQVPTVVLEAVECSLREARR